MVHTANEAGPRRRRGRALLGALALVPSLLALGAPTPAGALPTLPAPCTPKAPTVVGAGAGVLTVEVQPCSYVPVASSYRITRYQGTATTPASYQDVAPRTPQVPFSGLAAGTVQRFTVQASNSLWTSAESARSTATVVPFTSIDAFTTRQYNDVTGAAPTSAQLSSWRSAITAGTLTPVAAIGTLVDGAYWQAQSPITRLYLAYFDRLPDASGLTYWTNRTRATTTLATVSANFAASTEFQNTYGSLTDAQFVELAYQNVFHRPADPSGRTYWLNKLATGTTRAELMLNFSQSNEFKNDTAASVDLVNLYTGLLRRVPTAAEVATGGTTPRADVITSLLGSAAYAARAGVGTAAPAIRATAWDDLFTRFEQGPGVTQGDGARSTLLPDGRIYWSMGDSNYGTISKTWPGSDGTYRRLNRVGVPELTYLHSSAVITGANASGYDSFANFDAAGDPKDLFPPSGLPAGHSFWPAAAIVEGTGSSALLRTFLMDVGNNDPVNPDRRLVRSLNPTTLAQVGSTLTPPSPMYSDPAAPAGKSSRILFGNAILEDGGYTYVYGEWHEPDCLPTRVLAPGEQYTAAEVAEATRCLLNAKVFVARTTTGNLTSFTSWRYFSGGTSWTASAASPVSVADHSIDSVVKSSQGYLTFAIVPDVVAAAPDPTPPSPRTCSLTDLEACNPEHVVGNQLVVLRAPTPTGPWNLLEAPTPVAAYDIPDDPTIGAVGDYHAYLPLGHPAVHDPADANRILVGWSNDLAADPPGGPAAKVVYRPRFIWLDLSKL